MKNLPLTKQRLALEEFIFSNMLTVETTIYWPE
jgi:hypothetical protein